MQNKVKELRESKGMSQRQLARLANVSNTTIANIEEGSEPLFSTVAAIATALDVDINEITFSTES